MACGSTATGFEVALAEQRERSRGGRKVELARHAELTALYESLVRRIGDTTFLGYEATAAEGKRRRDPPRRRRLRRADRPRRGGGGPGPHAVLRRGRRPGRRPRRDQRARGRRAALHRGRTPRSRPAGSSSIAGRSTAGCSSGATVTARRRRRAPRADDAQPHGDAPAPPRAAQRRRALGQAGGLARLARPPALRLPLRPGPHRRGEAAHRGRGPAHRAREPPGERRLPLDGGRHRRPAPTPSSTRSTARRCARSGSRTTASSCAAGPTAGRPGRSAASSSPPTGASVPACAGSRRSRATAPTPSSASGHRSSTPWWTGLAPSRPTPSSTGSPPWRRSSARRSDACAREAGACRRPPTSRPGPRRSHPVSDSSPSPPPGTRSTP